MPLRHGRSNAGPVLVAEVIRRALAELAIKAFCNGFWFRLDQLTATQTARHLVGLAVRVVTFPLIAKAISDSVYVEAREIERHAGIKKPCRPIALAVGRHQENPCLDSDLIEHWAAASADCDHHRKLDRSGAKNESGVAQFEKRYSPGLLPLAGLSSVPLVAWPLPVCPVPASSCAGDVAASSLLLRCG